MQVKTPGYMVALLSLELFLRELEAISSSLGAQGASEAKLSGHNCAVSQSSRPPADEYDSLQPHSISTMLHATTRCKAWPRVVHHSNSSSAKQTQPSHAYPVSAGTALKQLSLRGTAAAKGCYGERSGQCMLQGRWQASGWGVDQTHTLGPAACAALNQDCPLHSHINSSRTLGICPASSPPPGPSCPGASADREKF